MPEPLDPQLAALGQALTRLAPTPAALDRDRILFEAGRAAARTRPWGWAAAAACAGPAAAQGTDPPAIPVTKLTVHAAAAPVPALRYRLLPGQRDLTPGNAVQLYYRAFSPEWITNVRTNKELADKVEAALSK